MLMSYIQEIKKSSTILLTNAKILHYIYIYIYDMGSFLFKSIYMYTYVNDYIWM